MPIGERILREVLRGAAPAAVPAAGTVPSAMELADVTNAEAAVIFIITLPVNITGTVQDAIPPAGVSIAGNMQEKFVSATERLWRC